MKTSFKILLLTVALCLGHFATAQEVLTGFYHGERQPVRNANPEGIFLPFFDDFSHSRVYPDSTKWTDCNALVNDGFPLCPPNRNAATLDVLDEHGRVYDYAISNAFIAEYLTSARIRLDSIMTPEPHALTPADSVYFSFYYQPQGNGMPPEAQDSLVLQFGTAVERQEFLYLEYQVWNVSDIFDAMQVDTLFPGDTIWAFDAGCDHNLYTINTDTLTSLAQGSIAIPCDSVFTTVADTVWYHVWSTPGQTLRAFMEENGTYFKQVMIPIRNLRYFTDHFYFRFYNYASIENSSHPQNRGNEDEWNIDFVYLNIGRNLSDPSYPMLTFSGQTPTFLNRYRAMPYKQYKANPTLRENLELDIANLDKVDHEVNYFYTVDQVNGNQHYRWDVDPETLHPYDGFNYMNCPEYGQSAACPYVGQLFNMDYNRDSTSYEIRHYVYDSTCFPPLIDSMVYRQEFYNYYAYDDGTPEMGYGLSIAGGAFAVRFELAKFDTIAGVQLLFNHTLNDANNKYFDIVVWRDENGKPGQEVNRLGNQRPQWEEEIYKFHYYPFDSLKALAGSFFIGIVQQNNGLINIGFDGSTDNSANTFYNANGSWQPTEMHGTIMIRPVVDGRILNSVEGYSIDNTSIRLYPNPASNILNVSISEGVGIVQTCIFDLTGRCVWKNAFTKEIPVGHLNDGLYLVSLTTAQGQVLTQKIIIRK